MQTCARSVRPVLLAGPRNRLSQNRPIKSHAFGVKLTHSRTISRSHAGGFEISRICERSCYVPTCLPREIFTSSTEESNPKLLSPNAFRSRAHSVSKMCLPAEPDGAQLTCSPKSPSWI